MPATSWWCRATRRISPAPSPRRAPSWSIIRRARDCPARKRAPDSRRAFRENEALSPLSPSVDAAPSRRISAFLCSSGNSPPSARVSFPPDSCSEESVMSDLRGTNAPRGVQMGNTGKIAAAIAVVVGLAAIGAYTYATSAHNTHQVQVAANDAPAPVTPPPPPSVSKPSTTPPDRTEPVLNTQTPIATPRATSAATVPSHEAAAPAATRTASHAAAAQTLRTEPVVERRTVKPVTPPTLPAPAAAPGAAARHLRTEPVVERRTVKPVTPPPLPAQSAAPDVSAPAPSETAPPAQTEPATDRKST